MKKYYFDAGQEARQPMLIHEAYRFPQYYTANIANHIKADVIACIVEQLCDLDAGRQCKPEQYRRYHGKRYPEMSAQREEAKHADWHLDQQVERGITGYRAAKLCRPRMK